MLKWAILFLVVALVAGSLHFGGIAWAAGSAALALFWIFLVVTVILFLYSLVAGRRTTV